MQIKLVNGGKLEDLTHFFFFFDASRGLEQNETQWWIYISKRGKKRSRGLRRHRKRFKTYSQEIIAQMMEILKGLTHDIKEIKEQQRRYALKQEIGDRRNEGTQERAKGRI